MGAPAIRQAGRRYFLPNWHPCVHHHRSAACSSIQARTDVSGAINVATLSSPASLDARAASNRP